MNKLVFRKEFFLIFLVYALIISIWAFNEEKFVTFPIKIAYIISMLIYCLKKDRCLLPFQIWSFVMILLSIIATLVAGFSSHSIYTLINVIQVFIIGYVTYGYIDSDHKRNLFINAFITGGFILFARLLITTPLSVWLSFARLGETIGYNSNDVGNKAMISAFFAILMMKNSKNKKLLFFIMFLLFGGLVLFSGSRKALIALVIGFILLYTIGLKSKKDLVLSVFGIAIVLIILYVFIMNNDALYKTIGRRIESMINVLFNGGNEASSIDLREKYMSIAWSFVKESPIVGIGLGEFAIKSGIGVYCHCDYLEVLCSYGFVGAIIYYSTYFKSIKSFLFSKNKDTMKYSMVILTIVILFTFLTMVMYISAYTIILSVLIYRELVVKKCKNKIILDVN